MSQISIAIIAFVCLMGITWIVITIRNVLREVAQEQRDEADEE